MWAQRREHGRACDPARAGDTARPASGRRRARAMTCALRSGLAAEPGNARRAPTCANVDGCSMLHRVGGKGWGGLWVVGGCGW